VLLSPARSPQVCALHVLQTLVRGAGLGGALLRHATPMVALALQGLGSPCWAMRNAAIQLFSEYRGGEMPPELMQRPWPGPSAGGRAGGGRDLTLLSALSLQVPSHPGCWASRGDAWRAAPWRG